MKCPKCKGEVEYLYTDDNWNEVCQKCLEKSIYKERRIKNDYTDIIMLALIFGLFGCILIIFGFILLITTPSKQPKGMTMNDCLEAVGDYKLCERKLTNGK